MAKPLITETDVRAQVAKGVKRLEVDPGTIVTTLAADYAAAHGVLIVRKESSAAAPLTPGVSGQPTQVGGAGVKNVAFGADHGGFAMKEVLMKHASSLGYQVLDLGTRSEDPCDYPDFAYAVGRAVAEGKAWRGIMIDGAGIGSCVVANKVPGVRAACCHNEFVARNSCEHNDANVLTLGSRVTGIELAKEIVKVWLGSSFAGGRHQVRVDKIKDVEKRYLK
jgi:ribose 5-phosphate isomerase B